MLSCAHCTHFLAPGAAFCARCGAPAPKLAPDGAPGVSLVGLTLKETYFIQRRIASGGMGEVYLAKNLTLDKEFAVKVLKPALLADPSVVQRFHRAARVTSRLRHTNIVNITDFGQTEGGMLFLVMEYVAGRSLARVIAEDLPMSEQRLVRIAAQILSALAEAHSNGILHRDLKPENVMIEVRRDEPDHAKVLDFDIAKIEQPDDADPTLSHPGLVCGTPGYMSPEQWGGEPLDARSDVYAVGVIVYQMLTGRLPFDTSTPLETLRKRLTERPPPPSARCPDLAVSPDLEALVMRALSPSREDRPAGAKEMREALLACELLPEVPGRAPPAGRATLLIGPNGPRPVESTEEGAAGAEIPPDAAPDGASGPRVAPRPRSDPRLRGWRRKLAVAALGAAAVAAIGGGLAQARRGARTSGEVRGAGGPDGELAIVGLGGPEERVLSDRPFVVKLAIANRGRRDDLSIGAVEILADLPLDWTVTAPSTTLAPGRSAVVPVTVVARSPGTHAVAFRVVGTTGCSGAACTAESSRITVEASRPALQVARSDQGRILCGGAACPESVRYGAELRLAAMPAPRHRLRAWTGDCQGETSETCVLVADGDRRVGATFERVATVTAAATRRPAKRFECHPKIYAMSLPDAESGYGILSIKAEPFGDDVVVNGVSYGATPRELKVPAGTYSVRVTNGALGEASRRVEVNPGTRSLWTAVLVAN